MVSLIYSLIIILHPIHLSVTEIQYSEKDKAIQITSRIFIDDLELSLRNRLKQPDLDILLPKNGLTLDQMALDYLKDHLKVKLEGKPQTLKILGHEIEDVAVVFYIEIENIKKIKSMEVYNDVIMESHEDQSNIVHVTYKGPVKSVRLLREKPSELFKFDTK
ncbi:MAG: hypothetical protein JJE09_04850 [Bacteroidia bacterium]|nr:hypothetical protein [Bacteroidia bacterium]